MPKQASVYMDSDIDPFSNVGRCYLQSLSMPVRVSHQSFHLSCYTTYHHDVSESHKTETRLSSVGHLRHSIGCIHLSHSEFLSLRMCVPPTCVPTQSEGPCKQKRLSFDTLHVDQYHVYSDISAISNA